MKNKKVILGIAVLVMAMITACGPKYDPEKDFEAKPLDGGEGIEITGYAGEKGSVRIPPYINEMPITSIGEEAFRENIFTSIIMPDTITSIGRMAFYKCASLAKVTIPNSVTSIEPGTFAECPGLSSITIPNGVTGMGRMAFYKGTGLTSVTIPDSVTSIEGGAFSGCTALTSVTFEGTITPANLNDFAFGVRSSSIGDLRFKYLAGGPGTYTRPDGDSKTWTKQSTAQTGSVADNPNNEANLGFPLALMGTWKRDNFDNTLTINSNTVTISSRTHTWELLGAAGDLYTLKRPGADKMTIALRLMNDGLVITEDTGTGQENWNGYWLLLAATAFAQTEADFEAGGTISPDIYIAGFDGEYPNNKAFYWKNGVKSDLGEGQATGIAVAGEDVYIVGYYGSSYSNSKACYWKNGVKTDLPGGDYARAIAVAGTDVYIVGGYSDGKACYWKNGVRTDLGEGSPAGIAVAGEDVYVAGRTGPYEACYWKNGVKTDLPRGDYARAIAVAGTDVYVVGSYEDEFNEFISSYYACYWKNGVKIEHGGSFADAITVVGTDVYIAGRLYQRVYDWDAFESVVIIDQACYWKNGVRTDMSSGGSPNAIAVAGEDVYVAGSYGDYRNSNACYWKNGVRIELGAGTATDMCIVQ